MKDTKLMIAVIGCFAIAVLFILVIVWEIKKSIDYGQKVRRLSANVTKRMITEISVSTNQ
jgi:Flp pilus assembly protein TadB